MRNMTNHGSYVHQALGLLKPYDEQPYELSLYRVDTTDLFEFRKVEEEREMGASKSCTGTDLK